MSQKIFRLNYKRHEGQSEVLKGILSAKDALIYPIICSRGWGKTIFATCDLILPRLLKYPHAQAMWVAPTYKIAKSPIDDVWNGINEKTGERFIPKFDQETGFQFWDYKVQDMEVHLFNESKLFIRSAVNPDSIVSKGYNIIVIDEAALIDKTVFMQQILPTARRAGCKIFLITTPRGKNWVYEMYLAGQDLSKPDYMSFRQPYWKRPDYPEILKRLMKDMPDHIKRQEYDAEFVGDGGQVFRNIEKIFKGKEIQFESTQQEWKRPSGDFSLEDDTFICAVDFAKSMDFTVITVMGVGTRRVHYYRRLNKTDYGTVIEIVRKVSEYFGADVIFDATGVGAGLQDFMTKMAANVHPFKFTNDSKNEIVNRLLLAFEYEKIEIPNVTTIREEAELFTYELTRTGKLSYNAPDGKHDDCIMSLALANWYATEQDGTQQVTEVDDFLSVVESIQRPRSKIQELFEDDS